MAATASQVAPRQGRRGSTPRRFRIITVDEASLVLLFDSPTFPMALFAKRVNVAKDRLSGARSGCKVLTWQEVRRLAKACAGPDASAEKVAELEAFIWGKNCEKCVARIQLNQAEARMATGGAQ